MNATSEQLIARAMREATDRIALPPEARWVPGPRSASRAMGFAAVAAAILIIAAGLGINAFRASRIVPASHPDAFQTADDAAWAQVRSALAPDVLVLRPTYIPAKYRGTGTPECPTTPTAGTQQANRVYTVWYLGALIRPQQHVSDHVLELAQCAHLELRKGPATVSARLVEIGPINGRGTSVRVRTGPVVIDEVGQPHQLIYLDWAEGGEPYEVSALDVELAEMVRVLMSLEPMR